ncbi:thrombomodulin-like [Gastrophryne carolinensis]
MLFFHVILALITSAHLALLAPLDEQVREFVCKDQACYSISWDSRRYERAQRDCRTMQGHLMTVKTSVQADIIKQLLSKVRKDNFRLWIGLEPKDGCTDLLQVLRGFTWATGDFFTDNNINWSKDTETCGTLCVTVNKNGTWEETECKSKVDGYLCEVPYATACNSLKLPLDYSVTYVHTYLGIGSSIATIIVLPPGTSAYISTFQNSLNCEEKGDGSVGWSSNTTRAWDCQIENGGCEHTCEENYGTPECKCPSGFHLKVNNRSCSDLASMCSSGYVLAEDGKTCVDIDECAIQPNICDEHLCENTKGGFICDCNPGYEKVDTDCNNAKECNQCQDIDECNQYVCEQQCVNSQGNYSCSCFDGFVINEKDPKKCKRVCNSTTCKAECEKNGCKCPDGYILEENEDKHKICVDVDECLDNPCEKTLSCENLFGSYSCICPEGYVVSNTKCIPPEEVPSWTLQPTKVTEMPTQDSFPLTTYSLEPTIWLGICIGTISMLIALITMLCRIRRKHYMGELNLDYKVIDPEKDVILQQVKTVPQWRL